MIRSEALLWASSLLKEAHKEPMYAKFFLQALVDENPTQFIFNEKQLLPQDLWQQFQSGIKQHIKTGVPYQQLVGWAEFYGEKFSISKDTLIPRFETEELVEWILQDLPKDAQNIVDIGTGTGVIALTLKKHAPQHHVIMTDISLATLSIAKKNARQQELRVSSYLGDALQPIIEQQIQVDILVSNPPYIAWEEASQLLKTVIDFEPHQALFAGNQGLAVYESIISQLALVLNKNGCVYFEIGYQQGQAITTIVNYYFPNVIVEIKKDLNGKDRMMKISNIIN